MPDLKLNTRVIMAVKKNELDESYYQGYHFVVLAIERRF